MNKINEIIIFFKRLTMENMIDFLISVLILLLFNIFSSVFAYTIVKIFNFKVKSKKELKSNVFYKPLKIFFCILGVYLAIIFLNPSPNILLITTKIFKILVIILSSYGIANLINSSSAFLKELSGKLKLHKSDTRFNFMIKIVRFLVYLMGAFMIISELGYNINGLVTGIGLGGVVVALAAQDVAKNIFGGITIIWDKPFVVGDWIETTSFEGVVEDITFRSTRIRTFESSIATIPNSVIANESLTNWSKMRKRRYKINLGIELSTPLKKVCEVTNKITLMLQEHPNTIKNSIRVSFDKITEKGLNILVYCYTDSLDYDTFLKTSENLNYNILSLLEKDNISIAYPSQTVYIKEKK